MGRSRFLPILFVALLLALSVSNVCSRKLMEKTADSRLMTEVQKSAGKSRLMIELMDYSEPEPNINPRIGVLLSPPPPPSPSVG